MGISLYGNKERVTREVQQMARVRGYLPALSDFFDVLQQVVQVLEDQHLLSLIDVVVPKQVVDEGGLL